MDLEDKAEQNSSSETELLRQENKILKKSDKKIKDKE